MPNLHSPPAGHFDEMLLADGQAREHYQPYLAWLTGRDDDWLAARRREADGLFFRGGITFAVYGDEAGAERLIQPRPIESPGWGLAWSAVATAINLAVARVLGRAGERFNSIALKADSRHLMTDVWTSVGVIAGVGLVALTGWLILDPLIAIAVGVNITREAVRLVRESVDGLMDRSLEPEALARAEAVLEDFRARGVSYRNLRTRRAGVSAFVQLTVLVPGEWTVREGHSLLDEIESALAGVLPGTEVTTHLEPLP